MLLDEFYSHFIYTPEGKPGAGPVSAAAYVERDPVLVFDGLTMSYRYPGWRVGWTLGPSAMIERLARAASSIDGGLSRIAQRWPCSSLRAPTQRSTPCSRHSRASAACWSSAWSPWASAPRAAPSPPSTAGPRSKTCPRRSANSLEFFWAALERKVMTVPGAFFDVDPGKRRRGASPYKTWVRFSFGPPIDNPTLGSDRLADLVKGR